MTKNISKIGFGSYRIADGNFQHEQALRYALDNGVTLIDTSTNYTGGFSEQLIGKVISNYDREALTLVSKFGYIQGELLNEVKQSNNVLDVVEYDEHCFHSIDATFLQEQLTRSLDRLNTDYIDMYLLHNPEYYLMKEVTEVQDISKHHKEMFERIYKAFVTLEKEVSKGRIRSYGISSNAFALPEDDIQFLAYDVLVDIAKLAAEEAENDSHHFSTIELPINLVEQEGIKCAKWAKSNGLAVLSNRPLNAFKENLSYRLASYTFPNDYDALLNETILFLESQKLEVLINVLTELDTVSHRFGWVGEYESFLMSQILPAIQKAFESVVDEDKEAVANALQAFLDVYAKKVAFESSKTTFTSIKAMKIEITEPMQKDALNFLLNNNDVDCVLLGMRKVNYVQDALSILEDS